MKEPDARLAAEVGELLREAWKRVKRVKRVSAVTARTSVGMSCRSSWPFGRVGCGR